MDFGWLSALTGAVLTTFGVWAVQNATLASRLRRRVRDELAILDALPENSPVRADLREHLERQIAIMVAEEEPLTMQERMDRRWGRVFVLVGVVFIVLGLVQENFMRWVFLAAGLLTHLYGVNLTIRARFERNSRVLRKLLAADSEESSRLPTLRQTLDPRRR